MLTAGTGGKQSEAMWHCKGRQAPPLRVGEAAVGLHAMPTLAVQLDMHCVRAYLHVEECELVPRRGREWGGFTAACWKTLWTVQ